MNSLHITEENINDIFNVDPLNIKLLDISCVQNIDYVLNIIHIFVNLEDLYLANNNITEIKGLDKFEKLKLLDLSNNDIKEIKGLNNLLLLEILDLNNNIIREIKNLDNLQNLITLDLSNNIISEVKNIDNLVNLQNLVLTNNNLTNINDLINCTNIETLYLENNELLYLPLFLCSFSNIIEFSFDKKIINNSPLPVKQWYLSSNKNVIVDFDNSLNNIIKDNNILDFKQVFQEIITNDVLKYNTKSKILVHCNDNPFYFFDDDSENRIKYNNFLQYIWSRIVKNQYKDKILKNINKNLLKKNCIDYIDKMDALLNSLIGFYDDIEIEINYNSHKNNSILSVKRKL